MLDTQEQLAHRRRMNVTRIKPPKNFELFQKNVVKTAEYRYMCRPTIYRTIIQCEFHSDIIHFFVSFSSSFECRAVTSGLGCSRLLRRTSETYSVAYSWISGVDVEKVLCLAYSFPYHGHVVVFDIQLYLRFDEVDSHLSSVTAAIEIIFYRDQVRMRHFLQSLPYAYHSRTSISTSPCPLTGSMDRRCFLLFIDHWWPV